MRCGSVSSQLDCYVTAVCADRRECGIWQSIVRSHGASRNESAIVQMDVNLFSVALIHMQTLNGKDTGCKSTEQTFESSFLSLKGHCSNIKDTTRSPLLLRVLFSIP